MTTQSHGMDEERWGRPLPLGAISLDPQELSQATASLVPGEDPEQSWTRYLRALALFAMRRWLKERGTALVIGPELEPEAPGRLLAIQGVATQLLCASPLAEQVNVPLAPWREKSKAPQLVLLAQVDEENGVIEFPGVLDAATVATEIKKHHETEEDSLELPVQTFNGGLERLLRWTTLLEPEAFPRTTPNNSTNTNSGASKTLNELKQWLTKILNNSILLPIPVLGTRGAELQTVRLVTPEVVSTSENTGIAFAPCSAPTIWSATPLSEILIEENGRCVWQKLATRSQAIEDPVQWPIKPLMPDQKITVRLRPFGATGGGYASVLLISPDATTLEERDLYIFRMSEGSQSTKPSTTDYLDPVQLAGTNEILARHWLALKHHEEEADEQG